MCRVISGNWIITNWTQSTKIHLTNQDTPDQPRYTWPTKIHLTNQDTPNQPTNQPIKIHPTNQDTPSQPTKIHLANQPRYIQPTKIHPTNQYTSNQPTNIHPQNQPIYVQPTKICLTRHDTFNPHNTSNQLRCVLYIYYMQFDADHLNRMQLFQMDTTESDWEIYFIEVCSHLQKASSTVWNQNTLQKHTGNVNCVMHFLLTIVILY